MSNNKKYQKWTPEWEKEIIRLVGGKKESKELKKGEVKPDGTKVTADQEKINTNEVELLLGQINYQNEIIKTKKVELGKKQGYANEAKQILKQIKELDPKIKEWDKFASWFESAYQKFLEGGTGGYGAGNVGWKTLLETYLKSKYKKVANTSPSETNNATATEDYASNLYEFSTRTETDSSKTNSWRITENEVIKLITRTVKELKEIDYDKFTSYTNAHAHPLSTNTSELDKSEFTATKLQGYLKDIQDRAKNLVDNTIKTEGHSDKGKPANGHRVEYSFGQDYTKHGSNTPVDSGNFTEKELIGLFRITKAFQDSTWNNHADFKTATQNIKDDTLIVLPAKSSPMTKSDFGDFTPEDLGIPVDSNGKSNFYATDYGTKIENEDKVEYSWETKKELKIESGIQGWAKLIEGITHTGNNDYINRQKLISSFTDDPVRQLFSDIRSYVLKDNSLKTNKETTGGTNTPDYACFGSGTDRWTYHEFPDFHLAEESRLNGYETEKASLLEGVKTGRDSLITAQKELDEAKKELKNKKKEVESKITEAITAKRKVLKEKFKVSDTQANDFTDNQKITASDHYKFQRLMGDIRFLVNNDKEKPTDKTNEDQAYKDSQEITAKVVGTWHWSSWEGIGWKQGAKESENCNRPNSEKIRIIKEDKDGKYSEGLNWWHDQLVELEKLVKLTDREQKAKDDLKAAIDNQTPEENNQDWRDTLKSLEADLATSFTDDKITKWKEKKDGQAKFNNTASLKSLLEKVIIKKADGSIDKVNDKFITFIKAKDAKLTSLSELIKEKEPKDVILYIHQWEFDQLSADKKKARYLKFAWSELGGKQEIDSKDSLTTEEKKKFEEEYLYQVAIGKIVENSLTKPTEQSDNPESPTTENKGAIAWLNNHYWWPVWVPLLLISGGVAIFWKNISEWWNGPKEEGNSEGQESFETESEDD